MRKSEQEAQERLEVEPELPEDECLVSGADRDRVGRGRALLLDDEAYFELAETFRALADGTRAKIVYSLSLIHI